MHQNIYHNGPRETSRFMPTGLPDTTGTIAPALLSGRYDKTLDLLVAEDSEIQTDHSNGDVEAPTGWFALIEIPEERAERQTLADRLAEQGLWTTQEELPGPGWYLYTGQSDGLSWTYECDDYEHAALLFSMMSDRYAEYRSTQPDSAAVERMGDLIWIDTATGTWGEVLSSRGQLAYVDLSDPSLHDEYTDKDSLIAALDSMSDSEIADFGLRYGKDPDVLPSPNQYVLIYGDPVSGFFCTGPFDTEADAEEHGSDNYAHWWVMPLNRP